MKYKLGQAIKQARENKNLTQEELSNAVGISRSYISDVEHDRYKPSVDTLVELSRVLDLDLNKLKED